MNDKILKYFSDKHMLRNKTNPTIINQTDVQNMNLIKEITLNFNEILNNSQNMEESLFNENLSLRETFIRLTLMLALLLSFISSTISLLVFNKLTLAIILSTIGFLVIFANIFILVYAFSLYLERNVKELDADTKIINITKKLKENLVEQTNMLYNYSILTDRQY